MEQQISATTAWIYSVLFAFLPYVAFGIFIAGLIWRIRHANPTIQALSTQFLSNDKMIKWGSPFFHFAVIGVFFGHIFGLLAPEPLYIWLMSNETKRLLAIIMGGAAGIVALAGITLMMVRRFTNERVSVRSSFADKAIVVLIFVQILTGLLGTYVTSQSPLESYMTIDHWAQGLFIFKPDSWIHLLDTSLIHKIHILLGFLIVIVFPFTKLMHMVATPLQYLFRPNKVINNGSL